MQNKFNLADREWESVVNHCTRETIAFIPVILPIPGTSRRDHLAENVQAADITLSDADFSALR